MTIGVNAILRMVVQFDLASLSKAQNVYHLQHVSLESKTDEQVVTAMSAFAVDMYDELVARVHTSCSIEKIECFVLNFPLWEPIGVATPTWAGTNVNDRVPSGVALMVKAYKERSGYADKKFIAGLTEENMQGDSWQAAVRTPAEAYADIWIAQFTGAEATLLLAVSYKPLTGATKPYTSREVPTTVSYQRRRKPGVGLT